VIAITIGSWHSTPQIEKNIQEVLQSGRLTYGPFSRQLEQQFAKIHASENAVLVHSGTAALRISLEVLRERYAWLKNTSVVVPATTFVATANVVLQLGLHPVFVDVDPDYYTLDPKQLLNVLQTDSSIRAVIPVHLFGQAADMTNITEATLQARPGESIAILEDSCETMFATHSGRPVGSLGDMAAFSMYVSHLLVAGMGGIILTANSFDAQIARSFATHGWTRTQRPVDIDISQTHLLEMQSRYRFDRVGYSSRLTELEAAIAVAQLETYQKDLTARQDLALGYLQALQPFQEWLQLPKTAPHNTHSFMMYPLVLKTSKFSKWAIMKFLEQHHIETREMLPLLNQRIYKSLLQQQQLKLPVSQNILERGFYIGCHPDVPKQAPEYLAQVFRLFEQEAL